MLQAVVVTTQSGGLWEGYAGAVHPVPLAVAARRGGGVRSLEKLLPQCIVSVGGWMGAHAWPEALHLAMFHLDGSPTHFLLSISTEEEVSEKQVKYLVHIRHYTLQCLQSKYISLVLSTAY